MEGRSSATDWNRVLNGGELSSKVGMGRDIGGDGKIIKNHLVAANPLLGLVVLPVRVRAASTKTGRRAGGKPG